MVLGCKLETRKFCQWISRINKSKTVEGLVRFNLFNSFKRRPLPMVYLMPGLHSLEGHSSRLLGSCECRHSHSCARAAKQSWQVRLLKVTRQSRAYHFEYTYKWWRGNYENSPLPTIGSAFQCVKVDLTSCVDVCTCTYVLKWYSEDFFFVEKGVIYFRAVKLLLSAIYGCTTSQ